MEEWKKIIGFDDYYVSNTGKVRGPRVKNLVPYVNPNGFMSVTLRKDNRNVNARINRLVAKAFVENINPKNLTEVTHIDGNKSNNNADNLKWVESLAYLRRTPIRAINVETGEELYFDSQREASRYLFVSQSHIYEILHDKRKIFKSWVYVRIGG